MKTIQQWLTECDKEKLINTYIHQYFNDLSDIPLKYRALSIDEWISRIKKNIADCIEYMLSLEVIDLENSDTGIIFGHNHYGSEEFAELVFVNELLTSGVECSVYAYEFTPQAELVGFQLAENEYTQKNSYEIMVAFLHEASFFGWKQEHLQEAIDDLDCAIKEAETSNVKVVDLDVCMREIDDKYGLCDSYQEREEDEKKRTLIGLEIHAFDNMCKKKELAQILQMIKNEREQRSYPYTMTIDEMREITLEDYKRKGRAPLSLDEINRYISEVRNGK